MQIEPKCLVSGQPEWRNLAGKSDHLENVSVQAASLNRRRYEGAFYHVVNRGNERKNIFLDNQDRNKFYEILGAVEEKHGIMIYLPKEKEDKL